MKHLLIVGARGFGREALRTFLKSDAYKNGEVEIKGFLDSDSHVLDGLNGNFPKIICAPEEYVIEEDDVFFVAMGFPKWRKHYADMLEAKGAKFFTIISETATVFETATIGDGCFIGNSSIVSDNVKLGKHVLVLDLCTLGHDAKIGEYSTIEAYSFMGGCSSVGEQSVLHVRSTLIRHKSIGNHVEVGSSSVVIRNVKDDCHVFGIPAKKIEY